jgi:hypothetical protein
MNGYTFLAVSIVIAVLGIGFYHLGPVLERWHKRLEADIERLKRGKSCGDDSAEPPQ